jgi:hypothetical protein
MVRVTGRVKRIETRSGTSKAGNPYSMVHAVVVVAGQAQVEVLLADGMGRELEGTWCDWLVRPDVFGGRLSYAFDEPWSSDYDPPVDALLAS